VAGAAVCGEVEAYVNARTPYGRVFVLGYAGLELLRGYAGERLVPNLDLHVGALRRAYKGQNLYVLVPKPEGAVRAESVFWKYPDIYTQGADRLLFAEAFGAWHLFEVVTAPTREQLEEWRGGRPVDGEGHAMAAGGLRGWRTDGGARRAVRGVGRRAGGAAGAGGARVLPALALPVELRGQVGGVRGALPVAPAVARLSGAAAREPAAGAGRGGRGGRAVGAAGDAVRSAGRRRAQAFYHRWLILMPGVLPDYFDPAAFPSLPVGHRSLAFAPEEAGWLLARRSWRGRRR
jgi:hypothetical protein